ncbi:MAG: GNAT family N-acetyltransferase [Bacteroidota bacterium]
MIFPASRADIPAIQSLLATIELFPPEILESQMNDYLNNAESQHIWNVFKNREGEVQGFCYCIPEPLTDRTFNLLAIGVLKSRQGKGVGRQLMKRVEAQLKEEGNRLLIVDTSGTEAFQKTRKFYLSLGYKQEAIIRDYWAEGDDKVVFWKKLL